MFSDYRIQIRQTWKLFFVNSFFYIILGGTSKRGVCNFGQTRVFLDAIYGLRKSRPICGKFASQSHLFIYLTNWIRCAYLVETDSSDYHILLSLLNIKKYTFNRTIQTKQFIESINSLSSDLISIHLEKNTDWI